MSQIRLSELAMVLDRVVNVIVDLVHESAQEAAEQNRVFCGISEGIVHRALEDKLKIGAETRNVLIDRALATGRVRRSATHDLFPAEVLSCNSD